MTRITIKSYNSWRYEKLYQITEMKDGCIYKTKDTMKCVKKGFKVPDGYITSCFSTSLTRKPQFEIDLIDDIQEAHDE